jgi:thiamine-phosphate pyrophosphorylase
MDRRLLDWARAVKAARKARVPPLWLFTDQQRLPDPFPAVARLPRGGAGVVLRHDADPERAALGRVLARLCRMHRLALVVAGDARLAAALGAGLHIRDGRWPGPANPARRHGTLLTSSAHDLSSVRRALRRGADLVFLSPVFPTRSHPGAPALGLLRWARLAHFAGSRVAALGGMDGDNVRRLPREACVAAGAIGALTVNATVASRPQCSPIAMQHPVEPLRRRGRSRNMSPEGRAVATTRHDARPNEEDLNA